MIRIELNIFIVGVNEDPIGVPISNFVIKGQIILVVCGLRTERPCAVCCLALVDEAVSVRRANHQYSHTSLLLS